MKEIHESMDRSWVDLFTNETFLRNNDPASLANIVGKRKLPNEIFWSTIHEGTHHWCFNTIFGKALFLLHFKTYIDAGDNANSGNVNKWDTWKNQTKYETVIKVYRPLLEGMALFAEHNTRPSESEALPIYLLMNMLWFSKSGALSGFGNLKEIEKAYKRFLFYNRLSVEGIARKKNILMHPLDTDHKCYLTGYLFVQRILANLKSNSNGVLDPNVFLYFIRNYFFNDLEFVEMLFDDSILDENVHAKICDYFSNRLMLLETVNGEQLKQFEERVVKGIFDGTINILCDAAKVENGERVCNEIYSKLHSKFKPDDKLLFETLWFRRSFFKSAQLPAYLKIDNQRMKVYVKYGPYSPAIAKWIDAGMIYLQHENSYYFLMASIPTDNTETVEGVGSFEQFIDIDGKKYVEVYSIGKSKVHFQYHDGFSDEDKMWFVLYYGNKMVNKDSLITSTIGRKIEKQYESDKALLLLSNLCSEQTDRFIQAIYRNNCLLCRDEQMESNIRIMERQGFYSVLGNAELFDQFTKYSILSSFLIIERDVIKEVSDQLELNLPDNPIELFEKMENAGFDNFKMTDNYIVCIQV